MRFRRLVQTAVILTAFCAVIKAGPVVNTLDTNGYNFQLNNGGGGASATLNNNQHIEIFCDDYANYIYVPQQNYQAYVTGITSTTDDLAVTRFGDVTNFVSLSNQSSMFTLAGVINGASNLARYQMAAYLVSQYNIPGGNNTSNNGIQQAIWDILDPNTGNFNTGNYGVYNSATDNALQSAASWFSSTSTANINAYLANYRIVSDATMYRCGDGLMCGGFQEQITVVPEPRHVAFLLIGLLLVGAAVYRRLVVSPAKI